MIKLGPVLRDLRCHLDSLSWTKRKNQRRLLLKKAKYSGIHAEWELETTVGKMIAEGTKGKADLRFFVTIMNNKVERDKLAMYFTAETMSPQIV